MRRRLKSGAEIPIPAKGVDNPFDMRKTKRVKFIVSEVDDVPDNASPRGQQATQSPRSDEPKTSEYAYFRKLKSEAVSSHSRSLSNENKQPKSSKIDIRKGEREGSSDSHLFFSPDVSKRKPYLLRSKDLTNKTQKGPSLLSEDVTPARPSRDSSPLNAASENSEPVRFPGDQYKMKGIFSAKRHRLRQWAAHTLFSEVDELHPKGSDLVSLLLSRLYPKGNENDDSSKADTDNNSRSATFHELNDLDEELHLSHTRHRDKDLPKICSGRLSDIVRSEWDTFSSEFPFHNYGTNTHFQGMDLGEPSMSSRSRSFRKQHAFSFDLPFEGYRSMGFCHLKELDDSPIDLPRQGPDRLLLKWDFKSGQSTVYSPISNHETAKNLRPRLSTSWVRDFKRRKDAVYSSISNHETAKNLCPRLSNSWERDFNRGQATGDLSIINLEAAMNSYPGLATSWNADCPHIVYDVVDANRLSSPSLLPNNYRNFDSVPRDHSTSYLTRDSWPSIEDLKFAVAGHDLSPLALPCPPTCITPAGDRNKEHFLYYRDQYWLENKFRDAKPQIECWQKSLPAANFPYEDPQSIIHDSHFTNDVNGLCSSRLVEAAEQPFTALSEGAFNNNFLSSSFEGSFDTYHPLLLDDARQFKSKQDLYFHDDNELEYD